ncbi:hypothetical protein ACSBR2_020784 [Camellia fascicularis]
MLICGINSDLPPIPQCLPLEPITLSNQKYTRSGELRRVLGVSIGTGNNALEDCCLKNHPPVATEELKNFKDSVQDGSRKARDRAKMLGESISKVDKYRKALISSKKQQRNDLLSNERSGGASVSKVGSQILRNPNDHATQRFEDKTTRTTGLGLKKRIRTSMADGQSSVVLKQQIFMEKDREVLKAGCAGDIQIEEKIRRLPAGEGWEKKMKRKRSIGVGITNRAINGEQDMKRDTQKPNADTKLRSCDALGIRARSSPGLSGIDKLDESFEPVSSQSCTALRNELETVPSPKDRTTNLEERISVKGINKLSIHKEKPAGSPSTVTKGKVSRAQRTGSIMNMEPSPQGSSAHPMTHWVRKRPHKISRTRRSNLVSHVINNDEDQISSQGFAASVLSSRHSSHVDNNNPKLKMKLGSIPSPIGLSEGEESGGGGNQLKGKGADHGEVSVNADHNDGPSILLSRKNKIPVKEEIGEDIHSQGKVGSFLSSSKPVVTHTREEGEKFSTTKQLQSIKRGFDKNKSKSGHPPSKKLKDRKTSTRAGLVLNSSSDFTGESDDDHEQILAAANAARKASYLACSGQFWKKIEYIFASVSSQDTSYLKQQLSFAEELNESLSQMFGDEYNTSGALNHEEVNYYSRGRHGVCSNQESSKSDAFCERVDMGRKLDKVPSLFQSVLSALIEEDESEEFYHQNDGRNISFQCASDDSHCGSCNHIDVEPKDRDRMESEVESEADLQIQKHCFLDRFSCNKSASSNTYSNRSVSSSLCNNEQWQADDGLSHLDSGFVSRIPQNDLSVPHPSQTNVSDSSSVHCQYQMLCFDDRLLLELQSIGLCPETMTDLAAGQERINQDIMELQGGLFQQVGRLKKNLGEIDKAIQYARDLERRDIEQVAMNKLVEMAYKKRMAYRGSNSSKSVIRKVSKQVALAFVKRTLARCKKFEDTGRSCFSEPHLQGVIFPAHSCNNDAQSIDCVASGTASNTYDEAFNHKAEAKSSATGAVCSTFKRPDSRINNADRGSSDALGAISPSEIGLFKQEPILNKGNKREVLLDDAVGSAFPKLSVIGSKPHCWVMEKNNVRDKEQNRDILPSNSVSGFGYPSLGSFRSEQKSRAKPKQQTNHLSTSGNGLQASFMGLPAAVNVPRDSSKEAEKTIDFANLQLNELDSIELRVPNELAGHQDLSSWLNFDEDGLQDHDSMGLEIPMDDLSELNMLI